MHFFEKSGPRYIDKRDDAHVLPQRVHQGGHEYGYFQLARAA